VQLGIPSSLPAPPSPSSPPRSSPGSRSARPPALATGGGELGAAGTLTAALVDLG